MNEWQLISSKNGDDGSNGWRCRFEAVKVCVLVFVDRIHKINIIDQESPTNSIAEPCNECVIYVRQVVLQHAQPSRKA